MNEIPSPASDAVLAAHHPSHDDGGPCVGCAFRAGTQANQSAHTITLARLCVEGFREFHCHEHPHMCRGFIAALNLRGVPTTEEDRRWCMVAGEAADIYGQCIDRAATEQKIVMLRG